MKRLFPIIMLTLAIGLVFVLQIVFTHSNVNDDIKSLIGCRIHVPIDCLDSVNCNLYTSPQFNSSVRLVHYMESNNCTECTSMEIKNMDECIELCGYIADVQPVFILRIYSDEKNNALDKIYRQRIKGVLLVDTCNAFLSANPHIPDNELYHTFVIDNDGKVLMVGNPFQNEKMAALFKKVIDNEQRKQKTRGKT